MNKALFIDRDGIINHLVKYNSGWDSPQKPQDVKLVDGIEKVIVWANKQKILVIEISNQHGVAKGKMSQKTSDNIEKRVHYLLKEKGVFIDKAYICPHHPEAVVPKLTKDCDCRKPKPGLILQAAKELGVNLSKSIFLGDNDSDVQAAKSARVKSIIYLHSENMPKKVKTAKLAKADFKVATIQETHQILKSFFK